MTSFPELPKLKSKGFVIYDDHLSSYIEHEYQLILGIIFTCFAREGSWSMNRNFQTHAGVILDSRKAPFLDVLWDYPVIKYYCGSTPKALDFFGNS